MKLLQPRCIASWSTAVLCTHTQPLLFSSTYELFFCSLMIRKETDYVKTAECSETQTVNVAFNERTACKKSRMANTFTRRYSTRASWTCTGTTRLHFMHLCFPSFQMVGTIVADTKDEGCMCTRVLRRMRSTFLCERGCSLWTQPPSGGYECFGAMNV